MSLTDLTFSKQGEAYVSDPVQLQSDAGLHLEFASENKERNGVALFQSMTNGNYIPFASYNYNGTIDVAITGVIPGMYIKVQSISQPTLAKILVSE